MVHYPPSHTGKQFTVYGSQFTVRPATLESSSRFMVHRPPCHTGKQFTVYGSQFTAPTTTKEM
jgi:hypothetical protein